MLVRVCPIWLENNNSREPFSKSSSKTRNYFMICFFQNRFLNVKFDDWEGHLSTSVIVRRFIIPFFYVAYSVEPLLFLIQLEMFYLVER